jgi:hypothetical protein
MKTLKPLLSLLLAVRFGPACRYVSKAVRMDAALSVVTIINQMIAEDEPVQITERELSVLGFKKLETHPTYWQFDGEGIYRLNCDHLQFIASSNEAFADYLSRGAQ